MVEPLREVPNDRQRLKQADDERILIRYLLKRFDSRLTASVPVFDDYERDTVNNERCGNNIAVINKIKYEVRDKAGYAGYDDLEPENEGILFYNAAVFLFALERPHPSPIEDYDGKDRAELDDVQEHLAELGRDVHVDKLIDQQHVAGARNGQPLGYAFDYADDYYFYKFNKIHVTTLCVRLQKHDFSAHTSSVCLSQIDTCTSPI